MTDQTVQSRVKELVDEVYSDQVDFLQELVATKSANPFTPEDSNPEEPVEKEVAGLIKKKLTAFGFEPELMGLTAERPNVLCAIGSKRSRRSLILNGHMDTAMPSRAYHGNPLEPFLRGEKLYGLGVMDMKASLSAMIYAAAVLSQLGVKLRGKLILEFVVDEEPGACSKLGTRYLLSKGIKAKAAIVTEPGSQIGIGHRGGYRFKLTTFGESIHTGLSAWQKKEKGRNAIVDMMKVIDKVQDWDLPFKSAKAFSGKRPVFTFPTLIQGGTAINMVPDKCVAYGDVRLMPGNSDKQVRWLIEDKLRTLKGLKYTIEDLLFVPAVEVDSREEVVHAFATAYRGLVDEPPTITGVGPWNDSWMFIKKDIPTVVQVPLEGGGSHGQLEWVSLESLKRLTSALALASLEYLGYKKV